MMIRELRIWTMLAGLLLLAACSSSEDTPGGEGGVQIIRTQFNFSLPLRANGTRMGGDVVQENGSEDEFRGMEGVRLLCFDSTPTASSSMVGGMIEIKTEGDSVTKEVTNQDYSMCEEISIPVGTSHFGFYAHSADVARTHEEKMKYGIVERVGLDMGSYQGNSGIRFRPVPLCTSDKPLGGSETGQRLLQLLNDLMSITATAAAPNDQWATVNNFYLVEAYQRMRELSTLSSYNVQTLLGVVNRIVNLEGPDEQGLELAAAITAKIAAACTVAPLPTSETLTLKDDYQGFPEDIHLPSGAARIQWDDAKGQYEVLEAQSYDVSDRLTVASINDYVYPMSLQYQVFSDIVASDNMVIQSEEDTEPGREVTYDDWESLLTQGYKGASKKVQQSTRSVAMVKQVEYAVGRLSLAVQLDPSATIRDADGQALGTPDITLKGYVIGGQQEVDYNFQPVGDSHEYAIYDTDLNGGRQVLRRGVLTKEDFVLGLGTPADETVKVALELVNNGDPFKGADGVIAKGATFYLVAELKPSNGAGYAKDLNKIFDRDHATQVRMNITSLASATYGLPSLDIPVPTVGISVNLSWSGGLVFDDNEL